MGRLGASLMVALALLCAIIAPWHVVSWDARFAVPRFGDSGLAKAQLWFFSVAVQAATWAFCSAFILSAFRDVWHHHHGPRRPSLLRALIPTTLLVGGLALFMVTAGTGARPEHLGEFVLNHRPPVAAFGIAIATCAIAGMFFVRTAVLARTLPRPLDFATYAFLSARFHTFLYTATLILSLGILGSSALRSAVNAQEKREHFPAEYVILYGAIFALLLLIAYVPVRMSFWQSANEIVRHVVGEPPPDRSALGKWLDDKAKLEKALDLDLTSPTALMGPAAAALPLLSAWLGILLSGARP